MDRSFRLPTMPRCGGCSIPGFSFRAALLRRGEIWRRQVEKDPRRHTSCDGSTHTRSEALEANLICSYNVSRC